MKKEKDIILELFAKGDHDELKDYILTSLGNLRDKTIAMIEEIIFSLDGKPRLKLLEILMTDGGPDLISLFIDCIRREKNLLYAKSKILLYREFKHQQALTALLSIEDDIEPDLKATYQRTLGRLLSQFSEHFYMSEFRAGQGNRRRVKFAVDMMLRSPHPDYLPFLNEQILNNDNASRHEGLRALEDIGDDSSITPMFNLLGRLRGQNRKFQALEHALSSKRGDQTALFNALCQAAEVNWDQDRRNSILEQIRSGEFESVLEELIDALDLAPEVSRKIKPFVHSLLAGETPTAFEESRTATILNEHRDELHDLLFGASKTLGVVAGREGDENFIDHMEAFLPSDDPGRDQLLIASMKGYRSEESFDMLVEYVNTCDDEVLLDSALDALTEYHADEPPKGVEKLCFNEKSAVLRSKALSLMAHWGKGAEIVNRLLEHDSIAVRADGVRIAAEYKLEDCYTKILRMLRSNLPDSLLIAALEALRQFPGAQTGKAIKPFLMPPHTISVRKAAIETMHTSGGDDRITLIIKTFEQNTLAQVAEIIDIWINFVLQNDFQEVEETILKHRELWLRLVTEAEPDLAKKVMLFIERLSFENESVSRGWLHGLQRTLAQFQGKTVSEMESRLSAVAENLDAELRSRQETTQRLKTLHGVLDGLEGRNPYQRAQALRKLSQGYQPQMIDEAASVLKRVIPRILDILEDEKSSAEILTQAIQASAKIRHPKLLKKVEKLADYPNVAVRNAVKVAMGNKIDTAFLKPIQSVFVMDDSRYITKQLSKVLAEANMDVDFENEVYSGMERLEEKNFDLLILDLVMPDMNGVEFLKKARKRDIAPEYTLIITSTRNQEELTPLMQSGVDGLLLKPFRMEDMLDRIKEISQVDA